MVAVIEVLKEMLWFALLAIAAIATGFVGMGIIVLFGLVTDFISFLFSRWFPTAVTSSKSSKK